MMTTGHRLAREAARMDASRKSTLIVYPPYVPHMGLGPYLSLPILAGYLRKRGVPVDQRDLNVEFLHSALDNGTLEGLLSQYRGRMALLEEQREPSRREDRQYESALRGLLATDYILRNVQSLKRHREQMTRLASVLMTLDSRLGGSPALDEFRDIARFVTEDSPYREFFRGAFWPSIAGRGYGVVGFTVAGAGQLVPALCFARMLAKNDSSIHIVLGGPVINLCDERLLTPIGRLPYVHSIVRFGGAKTLLALVESLAEPRGGGRIPNHIDCTGERPKFPRVHEVPDIRESLDSYFDEKMVSLYPPDARFPVLLSLGCYWDKCAFCSSVEQARHTCQLQQPEKLVDQIEHLSHRHIRLFTLIGEALPPRYGGRVADEIIRRNLDVTISVNVRIDAGFTPAILKKLRRAGIRRVAIGVESTNDRILALIRKGYTRDEIFQQFQWCKEAGIDIVFNIIFDLPSTTKEEALQVLRDATALRDKAVLLRVPRFVLEKGTAMWRNPEAFGLDLIDDPSRSSCIAGRDTFMFRVPFIDRNGMRWEEKEEVLPLYDAVAEETRQQPYRNMLWRVDPESWSLRWNWPAVARVANQFLLIASRPKHGCAANRPTPAAAPQRHFCYNFLNDVLHEIDNRTSRCLRAIQEVRVSNMADLACRLSEEGHGSAETVEEELRSAVEEYVLPSSMRTAKPREGIA